MSLASPYIIRFRVPLLPKLRGHFAEFLKLDSLTRLSLLDSLTCVGFGYGLYFVTFSWENIKKFSKKLQYRFSVINKRQLIKYFPSVRAFALSLGTDSIYEVELYIETLELTATMIPHTFVCHGLSLLMSALSLLIPPLFFTKKLLWLTERSATIFYF